MNRSGDPGVGPRILAQALALGLVVGLAVWGFYRHRGGLTPGPSWLIVAVVLAIATLIVIVVWPVRAYQRGRSGSRFSPLRAARALQLAQAGALTGAAAVGWFIGQGIVIVRDLSLRVMQGHLAATGLAVLASLVLLGAGLWGQAQCRLPDDDSDDTDSAGARGNGA
ncbi:MAG: DUF3180 domain-containing protein [Nostocoides sp.]